VFIHQMGYLIFGPAAPSWHHRWAAACHFEREA
jgi:hypothetical protein